MHPYPRCVWNTHMYRHNYDVRTQTTTGQGNIHESRLSQWLKARPLLLPLFEKKSVKNQLSSHRGGIQWQAFGGLGSWRAELELCAALSDLQSQFDWFKAPVGPPSSFSSPSNSPHGGFLSGLAEGLSEDARGWRDYDIWIAFCSKYIHGT